MLVLFLAALLCLWLSEKAAGWLSKVAFSVYNHTANRDVFPVISLLGPAFQQSGQFVMWQLLPATQSCYTAMRRGSAAKQC